MRKELIDIIGKAIIGVIEQGVPSVNSEGSCRYRGDNGTKCAVGMLISDDYYNKALEGKTVTSRNVVASVLGSQGLSAEDAEIEDLIYYLNRVQLTHDGIARGTDHVNFCERFKEDIRQHIYSRYLPEELTPFIEDITTS